MTHFIQSDFFLTIINLELDSHHQPDVVIEIILRRVVQVAEHPNHIISSTDLT